MDETTPRPKPANPEAHGRKCRRAEMQLTPLDMFADQEYGQRFHAAWLDEDRRVIAELHARRLERLVVRG